MKISYVIPVYNSAAWIAPTIESLLKQSYNDYEIIVVDDASTDGISFIKHFYEDRVVWTTKVKRFGAAWCRNDGNAIASGDIIAVCDAGDIYKVNRGELIDKFFEENKDKDIVYTDVHVCDCSGVVIGTQQASEWDGKSKPPISHPTVAYRKKVVREVKYNEDSLDTDFYEFFFIDAWKKGFKFGFINIPTCSKLDLTSSEHSRDVEKSIKEKLVKYKEYGIEIEVA